MTYRFYLPDFEVIPKPSRMSKARRKMQGARAQAYLENQEALTLLMMADRQTKKREGMVFPLTPPLSVGLVYRTRSRRKFDRTNIEKAIEDALVKAGIIEDDNVHILPDSHDVIVRGDQTNYWLAVQLKPVQTEHPKLFEQIMEYHKEREDK